MACSCPPAPPTRSTPDTTVAIQTSDRNGAYAAVPLTPEPITAMKAGTNLNIGMKSVTRKPVTIPVSLSGFTGAIDKLEAIK
ncbi:invasion associated locus B family protein [Mesorhizobium amorphae]|uniref:invasion associated locus B family protein n=1 Tax=Mesorhizobium amorphae TaxID=71433 RepID=UPI001FEDB519|nr:invasion associated locus B family protein [Mesorhizobium amorphae]